MIEQINFAKTKRESKTRREYFLLKTYDVVSVDNVDYLIKKKKVNIDDVIYIVAHEDLYDFIYDIHISTGHGGRDKLINALAHKYSIPRPAIQYFLTTCSFLDVIKCEILPFFLGLIWVGRKFQHIEEVEDAIEHFSRENYIKLWKRDCRKISSSRVLKQIKPELMYYEVRYACIHGGRSYKKKVFQNVLDGSEPCRFYIQFRVDSTGDNLEIKGMNLSHNHVIIAGD
ncbi:unnamed protein product [Brassicogethes aeneus]|uniref:ZSWIM3 N-terminal domain-containing protein n=1 Tax=Brassicogethes aeneus TaxID=1431903 RepID=A0A9P0FCQ4_BRAAE|nr:unnamed protein product [Brassicogethes aeneus]